MVLRIDNKTKPVAFDLRNIFAVRADSLSPAGYAFVASPPKLPHPFTTPVRGVFRFPNPVAGTLLAVVALWEIYQGFQERDAPPTSPIDRPPLGHDVGQWQRELDEMSRLTHEITTLQQQIYLYEKWGLGNVAQVLRQQLDALMAKSSQSAHHDPVMGNYLQAKAMAASGAIASGIDLAIGATVLADPGDDLHHFVVAADAIFRGAQVALLKRIEREQYHLEILSWYEAFVLPRLLVVQEALISLSRVSGVDDVTLQELYQRNHALLVVTPMYLRAGLLDTASRVLFPGKSALLSIVDQISAKHAGKVHVVQTSLDGIRLASGVNVDAFKILLDDLVRLMFEKSKRPSGLPQVKIDLFSGALFLSSNNNHIDVEAVSHLIQRYANAMDMVIEISADDRHGVAVVMIPPMGMLEVDPFQYVLGCRGNLDEIRNVVAEMTHEQRVTMLSHDMDIVFRRAEDQVLSVAIDVATDKSGSAEPLQELRRTAIRFDQLVQMLIEDLPPRSLVVRVATEMVRNLSLKVRNPELY